jgi:hypothetical protein
MLSVWDEIFRFAVRISIGSRVNRKENSSGAYEEIVSEFYLWVERVGCAIDVRTSCESYKFFEENLKASFRTISPGLKHGIDMKWGGSVDVCELS